MLKWIFAVSLVVAVVCADMGAAYARGHAGGGGGGSGRSYHSRGGSHSRSSHSSKPHTTGFTKKCRTNACFKKHPSGEYYVLPRKIK